MSEDQMHAVISNLMHFSDDEVGVRTLLKKEMHHAHIISPSEMHRRTSGYYSDQNASTLAVTDRVATVSDLEYFSPHVSKPVGERHTPVLASAPRQVWSGTQGNRRHGRPPTVCWRCGLPGHLQRDCTQPTTAPNDKKASRGSQATDRDNVYINMRLVDKDIPCLVDSGCEITLVPKSVVDKVEGIEVQPSTRQVWAANGTDIVIIGEVALPFELEGRRVETFALVTADIEEVMLGFDWLKKHECFWDFRNSRLYVDGHKAVMLSRKRSLVCRRVYVQGDVTLEPRQQLNVPARTTLLRP